MEQKKDRDAFLAEPVEKDAVTTEVADAGEDKEAVGEKRAKKRGILLVAVLAAIVFAVVLLQYWISLEEEDQGLVLGDIEFSDVVDFDTDITAFPEYMDKDRNVYYTNRSGVTQTVALGNEKHFGEAFVVLTDMIYAAIAGDASAYNACFSDRFKAEEGEQEAFTPQMLYDISIRLRKSEVIVEDGRECDVYFYEVHYKIMYNNGTLRKDIGSDSYRTQVFRLSDYEGEQRIDSVTVFGNIRK